MSLRTGFLSSQQSPTQPLQNFPAAQKRCVAITECPQALLPQSAKTVGVKAPKVQVSGLQTGELARAGGGESQ